MCRLCSVFFLSQVMLQWTHLYIYLCELAKSEGLCFQLLVDFAILFSQKVVPIYSPGNVMILPVFSYLQYWLLSNFLICANLITLKIHLVIRICISFILSELILCFMSLWVFYIPFFLGSLYHLCSPSPAPFFNIFSSCFHR